MYKLLHFLFGYIKLEIRGKNALEYINTLYNEGYSFWGMSYGEDGYTISCSVKDGDKLTARLMELGAEYKVKDQKGLPFFAYHYRGRLGLLVGLLIAMLIVYASTRVLWDVRIECNGDFNEEQVLSELKELGVCDGASIKSIDVYKAELGFLINNKGYSDIAINIQGTVAAVKLRLRVDAPRQEEKQGAFDVVASEAGIIHSVSAIKGAPAVKKGDTVAAGDMLISGTMQGAYGEYYIHHAYGSVKARVYREFSVIIPLETTEKVYTGREEEKVSYYILGKGFDTFKSEFSAFERADAETSVKELSLFGAKLPIEKHRLVYKEYEIKPQTITKEEAARRADNAFMAYVERELEGEVLNTQKECVYNEELNAVVLNGTVELITEIGLETPITVFPEQPKTEE